MFNPNLQLNANGGRFEELRSDEVQEVLSHAPPWALRWGNTVFLGILLAILALSWLVKYPEIISVPFRLSSDNVPKPVVAKIGGRLVKLWVKDNQHVQQGQVLAYIESMASHQEILALEKALDSLALLINAGRFGSISSFRARDFRQLGELQSDYQTFMQQFSETATLFSQGYLQKRRDFIRYELSDLAQNHDQLLQQYDLQSKELKLAEREFAIHQRLYREKVIAALEYNREERNYLAKQMPLKQLEMSITNNMTAQTQKQRELAELEKQANDQKIKLSQALGTLRASLAGWKLRYVPTAPQAGQVFFASLWQEEQMLKNDEVLFHIGSKQNVYFGEAQIPQTNAGKIKTGQRVLIKFESYPFEQFGMVEGLVQQIAPISSSDSTFRAIISLPNGLKTNAQKTLPFKNGLNANAEIVTENLRLTERFFYELRRVFKS